MQLPRIDIDSSFSYLGINQKRATLSIRQPQAEMKVNQPQPDVEYLKTQSKLEIDQSEAFADANLKHPTRVIKEIAQQSKQKLLQNLAKEASEGERLMKIETQNKNVIADLAVEKITPAPKQLTIDYMPSSADKVKFYYQPSKVEIRVNQGNFQMEFTPNKPVISYIRGDISIYLKQKAQIQMIPIGAILDQKN